MSPEMFAQFLELVLAYVSDEDRERVADRLRRKRSHSDMVRERCYLLRTYRKNWYSDLSSAHKAADAIVEDLNRLAALGFRHRSTPAIDDPKRLAGFEILRCGPLLSAARMRRLF